MLKYAADSLVYQVLGIKQGTMLGEALDFFLYDAMKVFLLLTVIIFVVDFPPGPALVLIRQSHLVRCVGRQLPKEPGAAPMPQGIQHRQRRENPPHAL